MILSLQGCMAAGKTTVARHIERVLPVVHVSYEAPFGLLGEIRQRGLDQNTPEGFAEIQRIFIRAEIARWHENRRYEHALNDLGPEEIEFFTLFFPRSKGYDWPIEQMLADELAALRACMSDAVLFLDARHDVLRRNKEGDATRKRGSFDHYLAEMLPRKKEWFFTQARAKPDVLCVDGMDRDQLCAAVTSWVLGKIGT